LEYANFEADNNISAIFEIRRDLHLPAMRLAGRREAVEIGED